jgi:diguanylate cyclase (GGDEF)-like protein
MDHADSIQEGQENPVSSMRILIADDSLVSRHLLEATLRKWSYDVVVACDGTEAWNVLRGEDPPGIAILDWMMPGMSGPEVCKKVRDRAQTGDLNYTYVLLLTSKSQREDLIEGMEAGADDYLTKPFDQYELRVRLKAGTRVIDLQRQLLAAREELREQATKDFLTRIWNRSSILEILERELARGSREKKPVGIVLADLDHFKAINDTYGHFAGDAVLREFTRRMGAVMRPYDSIGRYGGEEFLAVLPGCDELATISQAERMRMTICAEPIHLDDHDHPLTASFGACCWKPGMTVTAEALIRTADASLYAAKRQGRNQTVAGPLKIVDMPVSHSA